MLFADFIFLLFAEFLSTEVWQWRRLNALALIWITLCQVSAVTLSECCPVHGRSGNDTSRKNWGTLIPGPCFPVALTNKQAGVCPHDLAIWMILQGLKQEERKR